MIRLGKAALFTVAVLGTLLTNIAGPSLTLALSEQDKRAIDLDSVWHKTYKPVKACTTSGANTANGAGGSGQPGVLYLLGDSIGTQFGPALASNLASLGWSVQTNVASGRTLPQGLEVIDQDAAVIEASDVVVIELGTNTAGFTPENVATAIDKIRTFNPASTIYWVDTVVVQRQDYAQSLNNVNSIIYAQSAQKNYQVISWNKKVFGDVADPQNINANAPDNGYIRRADQYVHLTEAGVTAMADLVSGIVQSKGAATAPCPSSGSSCLVGGDNAEKAWNYLIGKGLTPIQAAGAMGNLAHEGGFNPKRVEDGGVENGRWVYTKDDFPAEMDTIPPPVGPQGQPGYGIVQWTSPGRKEGLQAMADERGLPVYDLGLQLDYMWSELEGPYRAAALEPLMQATDLAEAVRIWQEHYEVGSNFAPRLTAAMDYLATFGSNTNPGIGAC